jgi:2-keto-3-deoxy-galactonokinase
MPAITTGTAFTGQPWAISSNTCWWLRPGENRWIVPGLSVSRRDNHNVMRGEETQLLGAQT